MECGEELGRQPSLQTRSSCRVEASRSLSFVEQEGVEALPNDRGAERGYVDGPLECSLALGVVASETWLHAAEQQAAGTVPWIGVDNQEE